MFSFDLVLSEELPLEKSSKNSIFVTEWKTFNTKKNKARGTLVFLYATSISQLI